MTSFVFFFFVVVSGLSILVNNFVYDAELRTLWMIQLKTRPSTSLSVLRYTNLREEQVTGRNKCLSSSFGHVSTGATNRSVVFLF